MNTDIEVNHELKISDFKEGFREALQLIRKLIPVMRQLYPADPLSRVELEIINLLDRE